MSGNTFKEQVEDFLLNGSLYEPGIDISKVGFQFLQILFDENIINKISPHIINNMVDTPDFIDQAPAYQTINAYCTICKRETSFISSPVNNHHYRDFIDDCIINNFFKFHLEYESEFGYGQDVHPSKSYPYFISNIIYRLNQLNTIIRTFECAHSGKYDKHLLSFSFIVNKNKIIKAGQFPSVNDMTGNDLKKYKRIGNDIFVELNRAKGLYSHGVGIGAYAYLRRLIEKYIVNKKFEDYLLAQDQSPQEIEENLRTTRFNDKVTSIKEELSDLLHENPKIYGIISKGLHELSEKDCKQYFPVLFQSICIILDDEIENLEKEDKKKLLKSELSNI